MDERPKEIVYAVQFAMLLARGKDTRMYKHMRHGAKTVEAVAEVERILAPLLARERLAALQERRESDQAAEFIELQNRVSKLEAKAGDKP